MDLRELRFALRRHWLGSALVFTVCVALGVAAAYLPAKRYEATAQVFLQPEGQAADSAQAVSFVTPGLVAKVQTRAFVNDAESRVPTEFQRDLLGVTANADASVLYLTTEGREATATAVWANALLAELVEGESLGDYVSLVVLDEAAVPTAAAYPQPIPILVGSIALGALGALFAAVLSFRVRRAFDVTEDVRRFLHTRMLGQVPKVPGLRRHEEFLDVLDDGESGLEEAIHMVRVEVQRHVVDSGVPSVAVMGNRSDEGASTVALGLAWSLARVGQPVTVVDADLRRPTVSNLPVAMEGARRDRPLRSTGHGSRPMLDVQTLESTGSRPVQVLSTALPGTLDRAEEDGVFAIVDSPPLGAVAEARMVAGLTGAVILVVDRSDWDLPALADSVEQLEDLGSRVVGVVVNRVPARKWRRATRSERSRRRPRAWDDRVESPRRDPAARTQHRPRDERTEDQDGNARPRTSGDEAAEAAEVAEAAPPAGERGRSAHTGTRTEISRATASEIGGTELPFFDWNPGTSR